MDVDVIEVNLDDEELLYKWIKGFGDVGVDEDDKKKLVMDILYEGFVIYGWVLCLVVCKCDNVM